MIRKIHKLVEIVLTRPQDETSPEGRVHNRHRRVALTSLMLIFSRILNIATGLLTIPITLKYLGEDLFGVWMAITGVVAFMSFTDFGLGIGLQNTLTECYGNDDCRRPRELVGNAILVLTIIAALLFLFIFFVVPSFPVDRLIVCKESKNASEILPTLQAVAYAFAFGLPMGLFQYICNAYQRGYWGYSLLAIGRLLGFFLVVLAVLCELPLWFLAGVFIGAPFFVMTFGWIFMFWKVPFLRPWPFRPKMQMVRRMLGIGGCALVIRLSYQMLNGSIAIFIAHYVNAVAVSPFSITQRLLGVASVFTMSTMVSLWSAYGEAAHRGDWDWIRLTMKRSFVFISLFYLPTILILVLAGPWIILVWTGEPNVVPSLAMLIACAALNVAFGYNIGLTTLLNGLNRMRWMAFYSMVFAVAALLAVMLWPYERTPVGIIWIIMAFGIIPLSICYIFDVRHALRKCETPKV